MLDATAPRRCELSDHRPYCALRFYYQTSFVLQTDSCKASSPSRTSLSNPANRPASPKCTTRIAEWCLPPTLACPSCWSSCARNLTTSLEALGNLNTSVRTLFIFTILFQPDSFVPLFVPLFVLLRQWPLSLCSGPMFKILTDAYSSNWPAPGNGDDQAKGLPARADPD